MTCRSNIDTLRLPVAPIELNNIGCTRCIVAYVSKKDNDILHVRWPSDFLTSALVYKPFSRSFPSSFSQTILLLCTKTRRPTIMSFPLQIGTGKLTCLSLPLAGIYIKIHSPTICRLFSKFCVVHLHVRLCRLPASLQNYKKPTSFAACLIGHLGSKSAQTVLMSCASLCIVNLKQKAGLLNAYV
jgi:hypothetical protein